MSGIALKQLEIKFFSLWVKSQMDCKTSRTKDDINADPLHLVKNNLLKRHSVNINNKKCLFKPKRCETELISSFTQLSFQFICDMTHRQKN